MTRVTSMEVADVRFPTSLFLDGSDAMNPDPDYSAAYLVIGTEVEPSLDDMGSTWPTSPDDILAHAAIDRGIAPVPVATGEHLATRVMAKQFPQADALQVLQIDATRVAGVNENIAMILLAAKFGVPVCPPAGGIGLCEMVQHLSMFDFVAVAGTQEGRMIEYVDHLPEHFIDPAVIVDGRYATPSRPGSSAEMHAESVRAKRLEHGVSTV